MSESKSDVSESKCPSTTASDIHYYIQVTAIFIVMLICLLAIVIYPTGPNIPYFQSIATFCLGLFLPNPQQLQTPARSPVPIDSSSNLK